LSIALLLSAFLVSPPSGAKLPPGSDGSGAQALELPTFFITNRERIEKRGRVTYGAERSSRLSFGATALTPGKPGRRAGRPPLVPMASEAEFSQALAEARRKLHDRRVIVFVPGYACGLTDAVEIGERLGRDTGLPVVVFSWPSRNKLLAYTHDETSAEWSLSQFSAVLRLMDARVGSGKIVLIAYSMGARIVSWGLERRLAEDDGVPARFSQVLLCSPDMDTGVFVNSAGILARSCLDNRVYVSSRDLRLRVSAILHGAIRLGTRKPGLPQMEGIKLIDFTDADPSLIGHSIPFDLLAQAIGATVTAAGRPAEPATSAN